VTAYRLAMSTIAAAVVAAAWRSGRKAFLLNKRWRAATQGAAAAQADGGVEAYLRGIWSWLYTYGKTVSEPAISNSKTWLSDPTHRKLRLYLIFIFLFGIILTYIAVGIALAVSYSQWKVTDTFSMAGGCAFFLIGSGLAVAHVMGLEKQTEIMSTQTRTLMIMQGNVQKLVFPPDDEFRAPPKNFPPPTGYRQGRYPPTSLPREQPPRGED